MDAIVHYNNFSGDRDSLQATAVKYKIKPNAFWRYVGGKVDNRRIPGTKVGRKKI